MAHAFISYVREDEEKVLLLADRLERNGIEVWLDKRNILPGDQWREAIRFAIQNGGFFLCCFSTSYLSRGRTYMNEELTLAIEELRLRPEEQRWFIPVRLSDCIVPDRPIGAGRRLADLQWIDLFKNEEENIATLVRAMQEVAPSQRLRTPRLGLTFSQGGVKRKLLASNTEDFTSTTVLLKPGTFEMSIPDVREDDRLMLHASRDEASFEEVRFQTPHSAASYFRPGTGIADHNFAGGELKVRRDAHNHMSNNRLQFRDDGEAKILFHCLADCDGKYEEKPFYRGLMVFCVLFVWRHDESKWLFEPDNTETFSLSFF